MGQRATAVGFLCSILWNVERQRRITRPCALGHRTACAMDYCSTSTYLFFASFINNSPLVSVESDTRCAHRRRLRVWLESEVRPKEVSKMPEVGHAVPSKLTDAETAADQGTRERGVGFRDQAIRAV